MSTATSAPPALALQQAIAARHGADEIRWRSASPEFSDAWKERLAELMRLFGPRPSGIRCPEAMFVLPFDGRNYVIARVADLDAVDGQTPNVLGFHFLIISENDYADRGADPFAILDAVPPSWENRQPLPNSCTPPVPKRRTVEQVCTVLKREDGPAFLGGAQAILDGSRIAWKRQQPDTELIKCLWMLLPYSTRREIGAASFSFNPALDFHAVVAPAEVASQLDSRYISEVQAEHYPEGDYERGLQAFAQMEDQAALDGLFLRRSRRETMRLAIWLIIGIIATTAAIAVLQKLGN
jgi:hypothetical protein